MNDDLDLAELDDAFLRLLDAAGGLLRCRAPHDAANCAVCHDRIRRARAALQDGVVTCDACGDLGYILSREGPTQCDRRGCAAATRWAKRKANAVIDRVRRRGVHHVG
jgi:hypothetical protein